MAEKRGPEQPSFRTISRTEVASGGGADPIWSTVMKVPYNAEDGSSQERSKQLRFEFRVFASAAASSPRENQSNLVGRLQLTLRELLSLIPQDGGMEPRTLELDVNRSFTGFSELGNCPVLVLQLQSLGNT